MLIQIKYADNKYDYVTDKTLDRLLIEHKISEFKRATGWVSVGTDTLRLANRQRTFKYPNENRKLQYFLGR